MESSSVQCSNCDKYFNNDDIICASTKCGHLYHQTCLKAKFEKDSRLCDGRYRCSATCYPRYCRRVYLQFNTFNWFEIKPKIFKRDEKEFADRVLMLGTNKKGHNIYAARVLLEDTVKKCYYNAQTEQIYADFECNSEYVSKTYEILDISQDTEHQYIWEDCRQTSSNDYYKNNKILLRIPTRNVI
ncbi:uncharacterized protein LOC111677234 [Lucilia cuprina]|uniref:uncharacterized protein LOC111677234 n=1 Tax=Lucilia cuprina TaxID=7375 RepID=UPI001F065700|nr:uncharacterized protein LOC111677234 [Lucilia cuprina]